jgi:hypothetical protein
MTPKIPEAMMKRGAGVIAEVEVAPVATVLEVEVTAGMKKEMGMKEAEVAREASDPARSFPEFVGGRNNLLISYGRTQQNLRSKVKIISVVK